MSPAPAPASPTLDVWSDVVGQDRVVAQLRASVDAPVHAYLFVGPPGSGKRQVAVAFAAALLSAGLDGDDAARAVELARAERHPDLIVVEREGAFIRVEQADAIIQEASRSPIESERKVLVLDEFHLVRDVGPKLLKTIEEPPAGVVFVVLAEEVPAELVTIASRCLRIDLGPVPTVAIVKRLVDEGVPADAAATAAEAAEGDLRRARVLATDPQVATRHRWWHDVPTKFDGTGGRVVTLVDELLGLVDQAAESLKARQTVELAALEEHVEKYGERGSGRKPLDERHKRELRRHRTDEVRFGLAVLARRYRDAVVDDPRPEYPAAVDRIQATSEGLVRNPNERLQLVSLLWDLPTLSA
jgi:DNA polymerase-3 subunit delta'